MTPPRLAPPGAGLPFFQAWVVRTFGRSAMRKQFPTIEKALDDIEGCTRSMVARTSHLPVDQLGVRVLVPPMRGLEDSSRFWSPDMVLEHLCITTEAMITLALALSQGKVIHQKVSTANVKPRGGKGKPVIDEFAKLHVGARARLKEGLGSDLTVATHAHPWFGLLTASDWIRMIPFHMRLHEKQLARILMAP